MIDDRTSLTGSIGDFSDSDKQQSPVFGLPSQHSGFRSSGPSESENEDDGMDDIASDDSPWSPPAWRKSATPGAWYRNQPYTHGIERVKTQSASRSRGTSKDVGDLEEDPDATIAAKIPLPRGSTSPTRETPVRESVARERTRSTGSPSLGEKGADAAEVEAVDRNIASNVQSPNNCWYPCKGRLHEC